MRLTIRERQWLYSANASEHDWQKYRIRQKLIEINSFLNALNKSNKLHLFADEFAMLFDTIMEANLKIAELMTKNKIKIRKTD